MPDDLTCFLSDGDTQIDLPPDRYLDPDIDLTFTGKQVEVALSGAGTVIVQMSEQIDGAAVACRGYEPLDRQAIKAIREMFASGALLTLKLSGGRVYSVIGISIEPEQPFRYSPPDDTDVCFVSINFITKAP